MKKPQPHPYTKVRAVLAEGARVALVTCKRCGAALLLDPADKVNVVKLHDDWHKKLEHHIP